MKFKTTTHRVISTLQSLTVVGHSTSLVLTIQLHHFSFPHSSVTALLFVLTIRSQHISCPHNSVTALLFVLTIRSQHFSCPHNSVTALILFSQFSHSTSLVLTIRSQHFSLSLQFGHSTSICPHNSVITLLLSSQLCYSTSPFSTINTTTAVKIITKLLSVIPVFHIWCFCISFLVLY